MRPAKVELVKASDLCVGDLVVVRANQRVPADMLLLRAAGAHPHEEESGRATYPPTEVKEVATAFVRTDQLDGETDWKLRRCIGSMCLNLPIMHQKGVFEVEAPRKDIYDFVGTFTNLTGNKSVVEPLTIENTVWANTVVASSGFIIGCVIYSGEETRARMNQSKPTTKIGIVDLEINTLTKLLFVLTVALALVLSLVKPYADDWYVPTVLH